MNLADNQMLRADHMLQPYTGALEARAKRFEDAYSRLAGEGSLADFANGHLYYGLHRRPEGWVYREWAPNAKAVTLFGDFNGWKPSGYPLRPVGGGQWELLVPNPAALHHGDKLRILVDTGTERLERLPLYSRRVVQNPDTLSFDGQIWQPEEAYRWKHERFRMPEGQPPLIYECHVGMAGEEEAVATFREFTENVLPRVKCLGYNAVQLMGIAEHPYYGSFGYQVSNPFAVSSRFGTPEEFKDLVDTAHSLGIAVILDIVHAHAARNEVEGIGRFDGTTEQFFAGDHPVWGTRVYNYAVPGVVHFLLSNLKFWLEEYKVDGFRFDGMTSMLYHDHGIGRDFSGGYEQYFGQGVNNDAVTYLQLATTLCREVKPYCLLIAEDVSGMPGLCRPVEEGGIGFAYRLAMGEPDYWKRTLLRRDEDWSLGEMWHALTDRRPGEKVIGYCESHDQALVGDKTIMFQLAGEEMYWHMNKGSTSMVVERAVALHKMIRLATFALGGEGYLAFMGNEFGHPEWIDFPREGNGFSYAHARRMWSLADNPALLYSDLEAFDRAMLELVAEEDLLEEETELLLLDERAKCMVFRKGAYVFLFNFHPTQDYTACFALEKLGRWGLVLYTGWERFGGFRPDGQDPQDRAGDQVNIWVDRRSAAVYKTGLQ